MKRLVLALAATAGLAFVAAASAGLWLHWYMGQAAFIEEIRATLGSATGAEVDFDQLTVRGVNGIELRGLSVRPDGQGESVLKAGMARVTFSVLALVTGRVEVYHVAVERLELVVMPNLEGDWPRWLSGSAPVVRVAGQTFPVSIQLTQLRVEQARVEVRASDGEPLGLAEGVDAEAGLSLLPGWTDATGSIRAESFRLGSGLRLTKVVAPIRLANRVVTMEGVRGFCHGGTAEGTVTATFARAVPGFAVQVALRDIDLGGLLEEGGARTRWAEGTLHLDAKAEGSLRQPQLAQGIGRLSIESAGMATLDVLGTLGQTLGLAELRAPRFDRVTGDFKIADQRLTFYNLEGVSPLIELSGAGYVDFDGQLDFDMLLGLHPEIGDRIPANISAQFNRRADEFRLITFKLSGPISNPTSNLPRKLFAERAGIEPAWVVVR